MIALLFALTNGASAQEIQFNWPGDLSADVVYDFSGTIIRGDSKTEINRQATHTMRTERHDDNIWITRENRQIIHNMVDPPGQGRVLQELMDDLVDVIPITVVHHKTAAFVGIEDGQAVRTWAEEQIRQAGMPERIVSRVETIVSDTALRTTAADMWLHTISTWVMLPTGIGSGASRTSTNVLPGLSSGVETTTNAQVRKKVPCSSDEKERKCLELQAIARPDSDDIKRLIAAERGTVKMSKYDATHTYNIVADPATLQIYSIEVNRRHRKELTDRTVESDNTTQRWVYTYK